MLSTEQYLECIRDLILHNFINTWSIFTSDEYPLCGADQLCEDLRVHIITRVFIILLLESSQLPAYLINSFILNEHILYIIRTLSNLPLVPPLLIGVGWTSIYVEDGVGSPLFLLREVFTPLPSIALFCIGVKWTHTPGSISQWIYPIVRFLPLQ